MKAPDALIVRPGDSPTCRAIWESRGRLDHASECRPGRSWGCLGV